MSVFNNISYGSNLHPVRLKKRCPSARVIGVSRLSGWKLFFHKRSNKDGSAKCNVMLTNNPTDSLYVAVFEISCNEKVELDRAEGLGYGYHEECMGVTISGRKYDGLMYVADTSAVDDTLIPYDWYKDMVVQGAIYHKFPEDYINLIKEIKSDSDNDTLRAKENLEIVEEMISENNGN